MTISYLPTEILDLIFSLAFDKTSQLDRYRRLDLARLCLVSKRFFEIARPILYHRPLVASYRVSWSRALSFFAALTTNKCHLGSLVQSLEGLVDWIARLAELDPPAETVPFQLWGYTKTFSWYIAVLTACTSLVNVEVTFNTNRHFSAVLKSLKPSFSTLKRIKIKDASHDYVVPAYLARSALDRLAGSNVTELELATQGTPFVTNGDGKVDLPLESVTIVSRPLHDWPNYRYFMPKASSSLRKLVFERVDHAFNTPGIDDLFRFLPPTLEHLEIRVPRDGYDRQATLVNYGDYRRHPSLSIEPFRKLSNLKFLSLQCFHGPSIPFLDALTTLCPGLAHIDFAGSVWLADENDQRTDPSKYFDEDKAIGYFSRLERLRQVHLGILPVPVPYASRWIVYGYSKLQKLLREKGVYFEWNGCC